MKGERARLQSRLSNLRSRAVVLAAIRRCFEQWQFTEVDTPLAVPSPGLERYIDAFAVEGTERYLSTSPEFQMKRLLVGGMSRIYQLCRCFRANEDGHLHQSEFTMLEWYRASAGSADVIADTERIVNAVALQLTASSTLPGIDGPVDVSPPWPQLTVAEAFGRYADAPLDAVLPDEDRFFRTLVEQIEPKLGRGRPVVLTRWPASMASLARLCPDDPSVADRFEAYVDGVELCNGFGELTDAPEQRRRLEAVQRARTADGKTPYPIDERFVSALEEGMPPSGGNALGVDRLVMLAVGAKHIRDVIAFASDEL